MLNLEEAAKLLGISADDLANMCADGKIKATEENGTWTLSEDDVNQAKESLSLGDPSVLGEDGPDSGGSTKMVLGDAQSSGEVVLETTYETGNSDSAVIGEGGFDQMEPGSSRTYIGNINTDDRVEVSTNEPEKVLGDTLDVDDDADMDTLLGSAEEIEAAGGTEIKVESNFDDADSTSNALELDLQENADDAANMDQNTVLGTASQIVTSDTKIRIETGDSQVSADTGNAVLSGELDEGSGADVQTEMGRASEIARNEGSVPISVADDSQVLGADETASEDDPGASQTIIGVNRDASDSNVELLVKDDAGASDVRLATENSGTSESDVRLIPESANPSDSDVSLKPEEAESGTISLADLSSSTESQDEESSFSIDLADLGAPGSSGIDVTTSTSDVAASAPASDANDLTVDLGGDALEGEDLLLDDGSVTGSDITIAASTSGIGLGLGDAGASGLEMTEGSGIDLDDGDDDFVLGGSGTSDITLRPGESGIGIGAGESGIALAGLADSGISLEEPLNLGGSAVSGVQGGDSEFMLSPAEADDDDSMEDSGSQVIALEPDGDIDEAAATMLGPDAGGQSIGTMLSEDTSLQPQMSGGYSGAQTGIALGQEAQYDQSGVGGPAPMQQPQQQYQQPYPQMTPQMGGVPAVAQVPFSGLNVLSLIVCVIFLSLTGFMMFDMVRNIWSWSGDTVYSSGLMDKVIELINL